MKEKYFILFIVLLFAGCASDETALPDTDTEEPSAMVPFSAAISNGSSARSEDDEEYLHKHFINDMTSGRQSRIRVINTVNYSIPDFSDASQYKEYAYIGDGTETYESNKVNFTPYNENGFDWNELRPTAASFIFEAACYPNQYEPFTEVNTDQTDIVNFLKADLLLAHHAQPLSQRYDLVKLTFHHVFAMVKVEIDLPVSANGGFPENAIQKVELADMQVGYTTDYTSAIDNDGARTVTASGQTADISMYCLKQGEPEGSDNNVTQHYEYCGIVPSQNIADRTLVRFTINSYTGNTIDGEFETEEKSYIYVPTTNIDLAQGHITTLQLGIKVNILEAILLTATVKDWTEAWTDMPLQPDEPSAEDDAASSGGD